MTDYGILAAKTAQPLMHVLQLRSNVLAKTFYLSCNTGISAC